MPIESAIEGSGAQDPQKFTQMHFSFAAARVLTSAVRLNVFSQIAAGRTTASEVAQAAGAPERGMRMLLDTLVALQLLGKCDGGAPKRNSYALKPPPSACTHQRLWRGGAACAAWRRRIQKP